MANPITTDDTLPTADDVEMTGEDEAAAATAAADDAEEEEEDPLRGDDSMEIGIPKRITFLDYPRSPIISLHIGPAPSTTLTAHQDLLTKSPYFASLCPSLPASKRSILLPDDDPDAIGSFLEYIYNGEYFPRRIGTGRDGTLEEDPSAPLPDNTGATLLKHARIYTLTDKFGLPALKSLAHSKIHRTTSTARGEIAYARYVYASTPREDTTIRRPVAAFWATRSHVLRHEAEDEFRSMCLEFPLFGFDVLSLVLDQREKGKGGAAGGGGGAFSAGPSVTIPRGNGLGASEVTKSGGTGSSRGAGSSRGRKRQRLSMGA